MAILPFNLISSTFIILSSSFVFVNGDCTYSSCVSNMAYNYYYYYYPDPIPFPFRTSDEPLSCGLPGFDLTCNYTDKTPILSFPSGQSFKVESIHNSTNDIEIRDPQKCLPEKLMQFNSTGTPFYVKRFTKFTFYSCPLSFLLRESLMFPWCDEVNCLRGQNQSIVCENYANTSRLLVYGCDLIGDINVAGDWSYPFEFNSAYSVHLTWDTPSQCRQCESRGQDCRRDPNNVTNIKCFARTSHGTSSGVVLIILAAIALPILLIVVSICCTRHINSQRNTRGVGVSNNVIDATAGQNGARGGLEQATLNTYPIVVVGDSGRILICMEDKICPICLSEYEARDMIKSLPECLHRFHSACIDEWLQTKAICPVCRTIPPRVSL